MGLPSFIIIGCMKCGTTVLWHNLNRHPDIKMVKNPDDPKPASTEIRFFNNGHPHRTFQNKGIGWYKSLFNESGCQGEKCANYIEQSKTISRIKEYSPKSKLIICIRNPVDRAYSEVKMTYPNVNFTFKFAKKFGYLYRGEYYNLITNNVLPYFNKENIYFIVQERMKNNTQNVMNELYEFLGVSKIDFGIQEVESKEATNRNLDLNADSKIKAYKVWSSNYKPIDSELKKELYEYFKSHNKKLFKFLGYKIDEWL